MSISSILNDGGDSSEPSGPSSATPRQSRQPLRQGWDDAEDSSRSIKTYGRAENSGTDLDDEAGPSVSPNGKAQSVSRDKEASHWRSWGMIQ